MTDNTHDSHDSDVIDGENDGGELLDGENADSDVMDGENAESRTTMDRCVRNDTSSMSERFISDGGKDSVDDHADPSSTVSGDTSRPLLVASLEAGSGKTGIVLALALIAQSNGVDVGYMKPKGTRLESRVGKTLDEDPLLAKDLLGLDDDLDVLEPIVYSPTFIEQAIRGRVDRDELHRRVRDSFETLSARCDQLFVEGGGRLELGGIIDLTDPAVSSLIDARVLLVASYDVPGDIDTVLAGVNAFGDRVVGVLFNDVSDPAMDNLERDVVGYLENRDVPVLGVIPREHTLAGVPVSELADELGGTMVVEDGSDEYVQRFIVGAMSADNALRQFRRTSNAAVITGGDRTAIQRAALEAPGIHCLILTGGHRPSGVVLGMASDADVPVMTVQSDTLSTVERAEDVVRSGRARDERTVSRMRELLDSHTAIEEILGDG